MGEPRQGMNADKGFGLSSSLWLRGAIDGSFAKTELDRFSTDKESRTA